ncbi:hypothetical protein [Flavobacterium beibuense]|uniref:Lipoprotein n=1 Tax=Flavobacterium beibuense TaxID=657326 RepID=A0A444WC85_9FLAO|nr:hypothetical protein [Flavobacterium beibuense]RYJ43415.1 hypothetical protein NU09_1753 [Flavobacterium beibuense]
MKKNLLKAILFVMFAVFAVSCTDDQSAVEMNESNKDFNLKATGSVWDGVIGVVQNGQYIITVPKERLLAEMQQMVKNQGYNEQLDQVSIVKKIPTNNPTVDAYMVIATAPSANSFATGVMLTLNSSNQFTVDRTFGGNGTTCTGCATGCNLRVLTEGTTKIPYCDENGCIYNCVKSESSFY